MSRRANAGFTLVEMTVSLAISALAVAALTHLVHDAVGLDARLSQRLRSAGEAEAMFTVLGQLLADPQRELNGEALRLSGNSGRLSVSGDARAITIVSRGPRVLGLTKPTPFTLAFDPGTASGSGRVLLSWSSAAGSSEPEVVAHARSFELRYAAVSENGQLAWTDGWSRPVQELALIEANYVEAPSGRRITRLIPVVSSLPPICVQQPLLEGCPEWR